MTNEYDLLIEAAREYMANDHPPSDMRRLAAEVVAWADGERPTMLYSEALQLLHALAAVSILEVARLISADLAAYTPAPESPRTH